MAKKKRQRTDWRFRLSDPIGGFIRVGLVHNPNIPNKKDVIRLQILNKADNDFTDQNMTVGEAIAVSAGLSLVAGRQVWR